MKFKFNVGDKVKVVNSLHTYLVALAWVNKNVSSKEMRKLWACGNYPNNGATGQVLCMAEHERKSEGMLYYVKIDNKCYIMGEDGLKKVEMEGKQDV